MCNDMGKQSLPSSEMVDTREDFEVMYETHAPLIYRFMFWRTKDKMLAEDLTANVFVKAWRTRRSFTGGSSKAWLFRIARTTLIDHWRKIADIPDDGTIISQVISEAPEAGEVLDRELAVMRLQKAVATLPDEMQRIVELRFIDGLPAREVARRLNLSESNVRVIQYRALQKLRKHLQ